MKLLLLSRNWGLRDVADLLEIKGFQGVKIITQRDFEALFE